LLLLSAKNLAAQTNAIDSLQRIVALQRHDTTELNALLNLTNEYSRRDFNKATAYAHQAIALARNTNMIFRLANGYQYMITLNQGSGRPDSARYYLGLLDGLTRENPTSTKLKISYNQSAGLFYKNQGQYSKALPYMIENLSMLPNENESRAGQLLNIGNTYQNLSEYTNAVTYHLQSLSLFEKLNSKRGQSFCLQSLGNDFLSLKQYEKAKGYFQRSYKLKEELQDKRGILTTSQGLGEVYKELGNYSTSEKYYLQAIQGAREMKLTLEESRSQYQLALLYNRMGNQTESRKYFQQSLALSRQVGDSTLSAKIKSDLIGIDIQQQKEKGIELTLLSNLNTQIHSGDRKGEAMEYARLSDYYVSKKQFDQAYYYLKNYEALKDSIEGNTVVLQIKQLEEQFQSEKKEKEIELLKKDQELQTLALSRERTNVILIAIALFSVIVISILLVNRYRIMNRARREVELQQVRNHIARDLHDDIGSTLSSINIMSQLALRENARLSNGQGNASTHLNKIAMHSANMMEKMSDIVWSINPKNDSLDQVVMKMKEFAAEILEPKNIDYSFEMADSIMALTLDVEKRKNIFLIFKEAVNNAAKYSEGNKLTVSLSVQHQKLSLSVRDNGKGFNPALGTTGNGLRNMEDRAVAMHGKMIRISEPGKGTDIQLEMPIT